VKCYAGAGRALLRKGRAARSLPASLAKSEGKPQVLAAGIDELTEGVKQVYEKRRPRHGHEAAQILNFIEIRDPKKIVDVPLDAVRDALSRIARDNPDDPRPREYLKLLG
jgi:hypothetical protein